MGGLWGPIIDTIGSLAGDLFGAHSQSQANTANIKNSREQRAWEKKMSDTAVQRRVQDITAAGGNPALAFTNGQEATTPVVSAPHNEAFKPNFQTNFTGAALTKLQMQNVQADTAEKIQTARSKKIQADVDEAAAAAKKNYTVNDYVEKYEQSDIKTQLMRNMQASSAAEAKRQEDTVDDLIAMVKQQRTTGALNLRQLESVVDTLGLGAEQKANILQKLSTIVLSVIK